MADEKDLVDTRPITRHLAGNLLEDVYGDRSWDDHEWWEEMIDWLMERGTVGAARAWLDAPPPGYNNDAPEQAS